MLILHSEPRFYRQAGLSLACAQFFLFMAALPPFQAGIWLQTEPVMVALFALAALDAVWLAVGLFQSWLRPGNLSALWVITGSWVGWQWIVTCLATSFWRSWFGPPETGEGAGWYTAFLLQSLVIYPLWRHPHCRKWMVAMASLSIAIQCFLHLACPARPEGEFIPGSLAPAQWPAYLPFMAAPLWIALVAGRYVRSIKGHSVLAVLFILVLIVSANKTALVLFPPALLISLAVSFSPARCAVSSKWRMLAVGACVLFPVGWVLFSMQYPVSNDNAPRHFLQTMLAEKNGAVGSRLILNQIGMQALRHEPGRWVTGDGWGRFTDDIYKYVLVDGLTVFHQGQREPNWFLIDGYAYHSHNQPLEALLSLGLSGLMLWFLLPVGVMLWLPKRYFWRIAPVLAAMVGVSGFWFELAQCVPFQALGWAVLCHLCAKPVWRNRLPASLEVPVATALALMMVWSAAAQWQAMQYGSALRNVLETKRFSDYNLAWMEADAKRGGDRFRASAIGYEKQLFGRSQIDDAERRWYAQYLQAAHDISHTPGIGARVASTELWLQYALLTNLGGIDFHGLGRQTATTLPDSVIWMERKAPLRDDVATPMLLNLKEIVPDEPQQMVVLKQMLAVVPTHRPALWVLGGMLAKIPDHQGKGEAMMRDAEAEGIEKIFRIYP